MEEIKHQVTASMTMASIASDLNSGVQADLKESKKNIIMSIPDLVGLQTQYQEWGEAFKMQKTIKGKLLYEWLELFHISIKEDEDNIITPEWVREKIIEIHNKLEYATNLHRTAKLKYNEIITDGSIRYLTNYEDMVDPNNTGDMGNILQRNVSREKMKMIAEAKNKNVVAAAMIAQEEVEFFDSIIHSLNQAFYSVRAISTTLFQDIKLGSYGV